MQWAQALRRGDLAPVSVLGAATLAIFVGVIFALQQATAQPWLGLRLAPQPATGTVQLQVVEEAGPAAGRLLPGTVVTGLATGGQIVALQPGDLVEDPDFVNGYPDFNHFIGRQQTLATLTRSDRVVVHGRQGELTTLQPQPRRPVASLPFGFWFQLAFAAVCLMVSAGVFAYNRGMAALLYLVSGVGLFIVGVTASIYSTRELALPGALIHRLSLANHFGGLLFGAAYLSLMWRYPVRLSRFPFELCVFAVMLVVFLLHARQQWLSGIDAGFRYPLMICLAAAALLSAVQWRRTAGRPVERAALRWFFLVWFTGALLFQALLFIPLINDQAPVIPQTYLFAGLLPAFLVIPLGITRYRLFELDRWWLAAWSWFLGGVAVLLLDLLLVAVLQLNRVTAAAASVAVIGWLYFPVREWIWTRVTRGDVQSRHSRLQQALELLTEAGAERDFDRRWRQALQTVFQPLEMVVLAEGPAQLTVVDDGLTLLLPAVAGAPALRMTAVDEGRRLFGREHLAAARNLCQVGTRVGEALERLGSLNQVLEHRVAEKTEQLRHAYEQERVAERRAAQAEERERIFRDLHDDLGAKLLTLACSAREGPVADLARAALEDLRDTVSIRDDKDLSAAAVVADWRNECRERLDTADVALDWRSQGVEQAPPFSADARTALGRVLREALSNAIRHARPDQVTVDLRLQEGVLSLRLRHGGEIGDPAQWRHGRGLLSMRSRLQRLGGKLYWQRDGERLETGWQCAVQPAAGSGVSSENRP